MGIVEVELQAMRDALSECQQQPVIVRTGVVADVAVGTRLGRQGNVGRNQTILRQDQYGAGHIALNDKLIQSRGDDLGATRETLILEPWLRGYRSSRFNLF